MKSKAAPNSEAFPLSDYLCFAIYSTHLAFSRAHKPLLDELGLTYTQYITIIAISEEGGLTVGALGEKLFLESNTLTPMLKKLEAMELVERQRDARDERLVRVQLTKAGRRAREKAKNMVACMREATGLEPDEFRKMQQGIVALRDSLVRSAQ